MLARARSTWFAIPAALLLILALAGAALGATVLTSANAAPESETDPVVGTVATWEDADGDGIDDDCDEAVEANAEAAATADAAVDADADGSVSVSEAAHSERTGGLNCNHGGYVNTVAQEAEDADEDEAEEPAEPAEETTEADAEACEAADAAPVPAFDPATFNGPGAFGAYVSSVAAMDVAGGKNCNHGGAVSEAVAAAKEAAREARAAEKAAAKAERDAAKAERAAERATAKAERAAQRAAAHTKSGNGKGH